MTTITTIVEPSVIEPAGSPPPSDPLAAAVRRVRHGVWLLPVFGLLTLWATFEHQPSPSTEFAAWARFVTTGSFEAQHLAGSIGGQALNVIGVAALAAVVLATGHRTRAAIVGFVLTVIGAAGLIAGFGVAAFAQPAIGRLELAGQAGAHAVYDDVYSIPAFVTLLGGAAVFALASIVTARAAGAISGAPLWARIALGASGPLIGIVGVAIGPLQTLGSLAAIAGGTGIALAVERSAR